MIKDNMELSADLCRNLQAERFTIYVASSLVQAGNTACTDSEAKLVPNGDRFPFTVTSVKI